MKMKTRYRPSCRMTICVRTKSCAAVKNSTDLDVAFATASFFLTRNGRPGHKRSLDDGEEASPSSIASNPTVNISMPGHGMFVAPFGALVVDHERLARFEVLVRVVAELHLGGRLASELWHPAWIGPNTLFLEQGQRAFPRAVLAICSGPCDAVEH
jgi:hypothetical protein